MSYSNFKPAIWSKFIQLEAERKCRLVEDCWTQFEGEAKQGGTVNIIGLSGITVGDYNQTTGIGTPQVQDGTKIPLEINVAKFFNFMVDDIDRYQSVNGLMEACMTDAARKMAKARDTYIANLAKDATHKSTSLAVADANEAKAAVDAALLVLRKNDVDLEDDVTITLSPFFYQLFRDRLTELKTNNDDLIKKGVVGMYDNCKVKMSNNLYNDGTDDYMLVRSKRAIAFAGGIDETEAYRPEGYFADAVKGLNVFGGKIIKPNELYVIKAHKA